MSFLLKSSSRFWDAITFCWNKIRTSNFHRMLCIYIDKFLNSYKWIFNSQFWYMQNMEFDYIQFVEKKWEKMNFFTKNVYFYPSEFHQNRYQCVDNLILFYMTLNLKWLGNSFKCYLLYTAVHKRGNILGRPLGFRGDPNKFSKVHLWNIVSDKIIF